jgi:putative peptide zinc metalloprotease protein
LACKHYGGEVRELGFMLLVFSPCLYCDVSDAWQFPSKWRRIAVSSAGMAVEMVLAALATIVWWHAQDGIIKLIALNVMFIATVGTLLVNGNPLLRYDGYYILSDLVEIPNLWQRSRDVLRRLAGGWLRTERDEADAAADDPLVPARQRAWLAAYAVASKIYVAFVCVAIVWGLVVMLYPHQLQNVAYAIGMVVMGSALVGPAIGLSRFVRHPARRGELRTGRLALAAAVGLVVSVVVLAWPVNYYVRAPLVLLPADAARVNATIEGLVTAALPAGQSVAAGETIVSLENADVRLGLVRLEGEQRLARLRVEHLERLRGLDPQAGDRLPTARAVLADVERQLEDRRLDARRLTLVAPAEGVVIPVPRRAAQNAPGKAAQLPTWSGAILDASNRGAQIEAGTLVCLVGDPERLTAVLLAGDADAPRLRAGQKARLRLAQLPGQVLEGEVLDVARHEVREEDNTAAAGADLTPLFAGLVPAGESSARYHVQVRFERPAQPLSIGGRGQAKVAAERISLARLILRYFAQTFRLPV